MRAFVVGVDELQQPVGQARVRKRLDDTLRGKRRLRRVFEQHGVARAEPRREDTAN